MLHRAYKILLSLLIIASIMGLYYVLMPPKVLTRENNKGNEFEQLDKLMNTTRYAEQIRKAGYQVDDYDLEIMDRVPKLKTSGENQFIILSPAVGKYKQNGVSYLDIAKKYEDTYFDMGAEGWNKALKMVNGNKEEMWRINKQFLDNQIAKGKTIRLSHDPKIEDGSYFNREIDYLKSKEYIIDDESIGGIWYAKPRTD